MQRLVVATGNPGKLAEIREVLANTGIELVSQRELGIADADETGTTFVENALLKARQATRLSGLPALADDSGLAVDALHGAPGIYSARYAGPKANDAGNLEKLLTMLKDVPEAERGARFQCVLVYLRHALDPTPLICQGTWEGRILTAARGTSGFGYDPVFFVPTHECSAAELPPEVKNALSHRGQALRQLLASLPGRV